MRGIVGQETAVSRVVFPVVPPRQRFRQGRAARFPAAHGLLVSALLALAGVTTQADAACQLLQISELPVVMSGNVPLIPASVNGHAVQLLADTGAANSLIWRSAAREFNLDVISSGPNFYGAGGADAAGMVTVRDFGLAGATIQNVHLYVAGRGTSPGNGAGILGEDVLSHWDVEFDLSAGKIRLFKPKDCNGDQVVYWAQSYFMTKLVGRPGNANWLEANVSLDGHEVVALLDTGAELSTVTSQTLRETGIKPEVTPVSATATHGLANQPIETTTAVFPTLTIGQESVRNVKLRIADLFGKNTEVRLGSLIAHSVIEDPGLIIGADFFMAHRIYVARSQGKIYFTYKGGPIFQHIVPNATASSGKAVVGDPEPQ
jgi:predicted aspartyl protease